MQISTNTLNMLSPNMFKTRRKKFGVGSLLLVLFIGALFTAIGFVFYNSTKINASWKRVNGTVVAASTGSSSNGGTTYAAVVSYMVNGQVYRVTNNASSSSYPSMGAVSQVAYDPSNPQDAKVVASNGEKTILLIFPTIGVLMLVLGPVLFIRSLRRSEDINDLKQTGQKVQGVITEIQSSSNGSSRNGNGYRIVVSATGLDGAVQQYTSDWLQGIGGLAMMDFRTNPLPIDVYVDSANSQNYYVDVSEVPNLTPERITELIQSAAKHQASPPATFAAPSPQEPLQPAVPAPQSTPIENQGHLTPPTSR